MLGATVHTLCSGTGQKDDRRWNMVLIAALVLPFNTILLYGIVGSPALTSECSFYIDCRYYYEACSEFYDWNQSGLSGPGILVNASDSVFPPSSWVVSNYSAIPAQGKCESLVSTVFQGFLGVNGDRGEEMFGLFLRLFGGLAGALADVMVGSLAGGFTADITDIYDLYLQTFWNPLLMKEGKPPPTLSQLYLLRGLPDYPSCVTILLVFVYFLLFIRLATGSDGKQLFGCGQQESACMRWLNLFASLFQEVAFLFIRVWAWLWFEVPVSVLIIKNVVSIFLVLRAALGDGCAVDNDSETDDEEDVCDALAGQVQTGYTLGQHVEYLREGIWVPCTISYVDVASGEVQIRLTDGSPNRTPIFLNMSEQASSLRAAATPLGLGSAGLVLKAVQKFKQGPKDAQDAYDSALAEMDVILGKRWCQWLLFIMLVALTHFANFIALTVTDSVEYDGYRETYRGMLLGFINKFFVYMSFPICCVMACSLLCNISSTRWRNLVLLCTLILPFNSILLYRVVGSPVLMSECSIYTEMNEVLMVNTSSAIFPPLSSEWRRAEVSEIPAQGYCESIVSIVFEGVWGMSGDRWEELYELALRMFGFAGGAVADAMLGSVAEGFTGDLTDIYDLWAMTFWNAVSMKEGRIPMIANDFYGMYMFNQSFTQVVLDFLVMAYILLFVRFWFGSAKSKYLCCQVETGHIVNLSASLWKNCVFMALRLWAWYYYYVPVSLFILKNVASIFTSFVDLRHAIRQTKCFCPCCKRRSSNRRTLESDSESAE
eukprot:TRINITY_DN17761_c0_g1_i2.p1 TRINITY_DN17761_c0_g1~~TRINITY_DN17761_c0_g1_i2.p1  ORF type:complete len:872 (-),score=80.97 TRINITY_DN17761_c0_g1_i2:51-2363(-)